MRWEETVETIPAVGPRCEAPSEVEVDLVGVLLLVEPIGSSLPDVELCFGDGLVRDKVSDCTVNISMLAVWDVVDDRGVHRVFGGVGSIERAQHGSKRWGILGGGDDFVSYFINKGFEADDVAEE